MKKILAIVLMTAVLVCPAFASGEAAAKTAEAPHYALEVIQEPTCTEKGISAYVDSETGEVLFTFETATVAHNYVDVVKEATCDEDGSVAKVCTICGDVLSEEIIPATGHVPSAAAPTCTDPVVCTVCGEVLEPAVGHVYEYQYDAVQNEDGTFASFGTWKCVNCGDVVAATEGNAVYYYGQKEEAAASAEASGEPASEEAPAAEAAAGNPNYDPDAHNWASIEIIMALIIVVVGAVLMLSFGKKKKED